ncbi:MAG: prolyl oligopeptidase family serine peptidase [Gammaproteobacteria bacterium]|nr:prolyl oligopeptidase family serine peptidase [Gammaproteobacteria bacterium]
MTLFLDQSVIQLNNGIQGEMWTVKTANPVNFYQALSAPNKAPKTTIYAQNFLPKGIEKPPAVIIVPGSMGVAPSHVLKAELLTQAGIAACIIDPFGTRGVSSTVSNQAQYSFAASAWDVLATLDQLTHQAHVDPCRIGAQGHSRGGSAVLSAACMQRLTKFETRLSGVYAAYPWCGQQFLLPQVDNTKVRSIIGDQDEWTLPQQVQAHMQAIRLCGGDASCRIVAGAHHSFDRETPIEITADASVSPGAPTIYLQDNGAYIHPVTGEANPETSERELMLYGIKAGYGVRGARIGTSDNLVQTFNEDMMGFWRGCLQT